MKTPTFFLTLIAMSVLSSSPVAAGLIESVYGKMLDGREVKLYTLTNASGMEAKITEYGAILVSLKVPDKDGKLADVTQGYDTLEGWLGNSSYFGATVGRFGNRIAGGKFSLDVRRDSETRGKTSALGADGSYLLHHLSAGRLDPPISTQIVESGKIALDLPAP